MKFEKRDRKKKVFWDFFSVFPADAGMIPIFPRAKPFFAGVPRGCGDDPC